jgi:hypothetical protein
MTTACKLAIVHLEPIDIHAKAKAEIAARDWGAVHVWADKQKPVEIGERRRGWR